MRASVTASITNPQTRPWWAALHDEGGRPVEPIAWAPWDLLAREAQFGLTHESEWLVHVPSLALVTWPDHRAFREEALSRYGAALRRVLAAGEDELRRRRAERALREAQRTLGILRALEVLRAIVPARLTVEAKIAAPPRQRAWYHARIAPSVRPVAREG